MALAVSPLAASSLATWGFLGLKVSGLVGLIESYGSSSSRRRRRRRRRRSSNNNSSNNSRSSRNNKNDNMKVLAIRGSY